MIDIEKDKILSDKIDKWSEEYEQKERENNKSGKKTPQEKQEDNIRYFKAFFKNLEKWKKE